MTAGALRVLVVVASRHGSTREIGDRLTRWLPEEDAARPPGTVTTGTSTAGTRPAGITAVLVAAEHGPDPSGYDAVLVGSAVYHGRWLESAHHYVTAHAGALRELPVWLFSSGPIGEPPFPPDEPHDAHPLAQVSGARGHRVFPGRLDPARLSPGELATVTAMRAPLGDFRDWPVVRAWAREIAAVLVAPEDPTD